MTNNTDLSPLVQEIRELLAKIDEPWRIIFDYPMMLGTAVALQRGREIRHQEKTGQVFGLLLGRKHDWPSEPWEQLVAMPRLLRLLTAEYETLQREKAVLIQDASDSHAAWEEEKTKAEAAEARAEAAEARLREEWWLGHGHGGLYGDDGEMQCNKCAPLWDYKRAPLNELQAHVERVRLERVAAALASPVTDAAEPQKHMKHRCSGCGHRWDDIYEGFVLRGAELCGDCWRKVQPVVHAAEPQWTPEETEQVVELLTDPKNRDAAEPQPTTLHRELAKRGIKTRDAAEPQKEQDLGLLGTAACVDSRHPSSTPSDEATRAYPVRICNACYQLKGEMCHNAECVFCRRTMREVGEALDLLLIRPVVDGERLDLHPLNDHCKEENTNVARSEGTRE